MTDVCTLREQLNSIRRLHKRLEHDLERREALMAKATRANAPMSADKVQTSLSGGHAVIMATIADLDTIIDAEKAYLEGLKNWAKDFFESGDLEREELEVMLLRYVSCLDWDEIAEIMYWSRRQVQRLHGSALVKLGTLWHTLAHSDTHFL